MSSAAPRRSLYLPAMGILHILLAVALLAVVWLRLGKPPLPEEATPYWNFAAFIFTPFSLLLLLTGLLAFRPTPWGYGLVVVTALVCIPTLWWAATDGIDPLPALGFIPLVLLAPLEAHLCLEYQRRLP